MSLNCGKKVPGENQCTQGEHSNSWEVQTGNLAVRRQDQPNLETHFSFFVNVKGIKLYSLKYLQLSDKSRGVQSRTIIKLDKINEFVFLLKDVLE